jgi:hypothetical protein
MAKAEILSGICGFKTQVTTQMDTDNCLVSIESDCPSIQKLAAQLTTVDPFAEISFRGELPQTYQIAFKNCPHAACPVPASIIKAIEVEAGLALPADASIKLSR